LEPRGIEDGDLAIRASGGEERAVGAEGEGDRTFLLQRNGAGEMPAPRVVKRDGAVRGDGEPLMRGVEREDAREVDRRVLVAERPVDVAGDVAGLDAPQRRRTLRIGAVLVGSGGQEVAPVRGEGERAAKAQ